MSEKSRFYPDMLDLWEVQETACPDCTQPLHIQSGQDIAFCPNCSIDHINAAKGRLLLEQTKLADWKSRQPAKIEIARADKPFWPEGMPL